MRLLGNQIRGRELSQDEALNQMLECLLRWRGILTERAIAASRYVSSSLYDMHVSSFSYDTELAIAEARAENAELVAAGCESGRFQGYVRMSLVTVDEKLTVLDSMIKSSVLCNTDYKRRYFVLRDGWLRCHIIIQCHIIIHSVTSSYFVLREGCLRCLCTHTCDCACVWFSVV
jgi:hypothetical protein